MGLFLSGGSLPSLKSNNSSTIKKTTKATSGTPQNGASTYDAKYDPNNRNTGLLSDYSGIVAQQIGSAPKSSGSGVRSIDLTPMISSLTQGANSQKEIVKNEGNTKRQSLLETISRMQEDTAKAREKQQRTYNSARGDLEDKAFLSERSIKAGKSAKGLGAGGLKDLAILRGDIEAGNNISEIANENIEKQGELSTNLLRGTKDANDAIQAAITEEALKLSGIDANLAQEIASLQLQEKQRVSAARSGGSGAINEYNTNKLAVENYVKDAQADASGVLSKYLILSAKEQKKETNKTAALNELVDLKRKYGTILPDSDVKLLSDKITSAYSKAGGK